MKNRERILIDTRYDNIVKTNIDRNNYISDLDQWAKTGFSTSRTTKNRLNLSASPALEKIAKIAQGKMKDPNEAKGEDKEWTSISCNKHII